MVADGHIGGFKTSGGHHRIVAESIESLREHRGQPRPVRGASSVLESRRETLEELTLEAQEMRAKREIERLRREEAEEAEKREAEEEDREQEAAERREALAFERERWERQQRQERESMEAARRLAAFRNRWLEAATVALSAKQGLQLSASDRKEILDALEAEISRRTLQDEPRMPVIVDHSISALVEPILAARKAAKRRQEAVERALWSLSAFATNSEKAQAAVAARNAVSALPPEATEVEVRAAAEEAITPVQLAIEKRLLNQRLMSWLSWQLPFWSDEGEKAKLRRKCAEILAGLPSHASELEARNALEPTIAEARREIEERQAREDRERRKANLIAYGISEVSSYLGELQRQGEISNKELWDSELTADLDRAVEAELKQELTGDETTKEVKELVREAIDGELF